MGKRYKYKLTLRLPFDFAQGAAQGKKLKHYRQKPWKGVINNPGQSPGTFK